MKKRLISIGIASLVLFGVFSCARQVTRVNPDKTIDLSGRWNDTDSKLVAQEMSKDVLARAWRDNFMKIKGRNPVVIVGMVNNKTSEFIEPEVFIKDVEKEFINAGTVRVVTNSVFREKLRTERADQQQYASQESMKKWGKELGADFMLFGTINAITDGRGKKQTIYYKVNLELADIETNEIVWVGDKEIKKLIVN
ncbi:MAG: hypothetical protein RLZZ175_2307 [Bacteroidota bacterium]|jgi:uncharacterized protein (TIGR02722 family)